MVRYNQPMAGEPSRPVVTLSMPGADPLAGVTIGGHYTLLEKIGEGGMGVVYRGEDTTTRAPIAVKLLLPELGRIGEVAQRFEREAQAMRRLRHPHIVSVADFGRLDSGALYLVMELLEGQSLARVVRTQGPMPIERAIHIMRQMLGAIDHAHHQGVIHRDLKPENVMLLAGDGVKILDFGIAKIRDDSTQSEMIKLTQAGLTVGTPEYMSPEQAGGLDVDGRADVYACGVLLFEMLTGKRPFAAKNAVDLMVMQTTMPAPPPCTPKPWLDAAVLRALEKDPERRFATAGAFQEALQEPEPVAAKPVGWGRRAWRSARFAVDRTWSAFWGSPRMMSLRVRTRIWWVTQPGAVRRTIAIAVIGVWVAGACSLFFLRHPAPAPSVAAPPPAAAVAAEVAPPEAKPAPAAHKPAKSSRLRSRRRHETAATR